MQVVRLDAGRNTSLVGSTSTFKRVSDAVENECCHTWCSDRQSTGGAEHALRRSYLDNVICCWDEHWETYPDIPPKTLLFHLPRLERAFEDEEYADGGDSMTPFGVNGN